MMMIVTTTQIVSRIGNNDDDGCDDCDDYDVRDNNTDWEQ